MIETVIPNMRLLVLPSLLQGADWFELSRELDHFLVSEGLDLADESVYLVFNRAPAATLAGEGETMVGRSVIGPRKDYPSAFRVQDFVAASVISQELTGKNWQDVFGEAQIVWEELQRQGRRVSSSFIIKLKRRLEPQLTLKTEVFFPV